MRKTKPLSKDDLCYEEEEEVDENGVCDYVPGDPVAMFTFDNNTVPSNEPMLKTKAVEPSLEVSPAPNTKLPHNRTQRSQANGVTPPIEGEYFLTKRGFLFRKSTLRKLNELKAIHPNEAVYLSSIVDKALCHYYEYIFKENGSQE
jgi:hypothetical protein